MALSDFTGFSPNHQDWPAFLTSEQPATSVVVGLRSAQSDLRFPMALRIVIVPVPFPRYVRNPMRYRRLKVRGGCYFFMAVTHRREPLFVDLRTVDLLFEVIGRVQQQHPFSIDAHVVLPDHLHMIWSLPNSDTDFSTRWMLIKTGFTRSYRKGTRRVQEPTGSQFGRTGSGNTSSVTSAITPPTSNIFISIQ